MEKFYKYLDTKQDTSKQPLGQRKNQKGNKKLSEKRKQNTKYQILWYAAKAVLRGILIAINAYIKRLERSQIM